MTDIVKFLSARIDEDERGATEWVACFSPSHPTVIGGERLLAECEARRRILRLHPEMLTICQGCAAELFPCRTVAALALPYADHPDYDPAWATA